MTLNEVRKKWEKGLTLILEFSVDKTHYTVLRKLGTFDTIYIVNRYFQIGEGWHCSVDVETEEPEVIMQYMKEYL